MPHISQARTVIMLLIASLCINAAAQSKSSIKTRVNNKGHVTVQAPDALDKRNNADIGRSTQRNSGNKQTEQGESSAADEKDKTDSKREENRPPKRTHTTQQTIQGQAVGYRIQCLSDNNTSTAKAAAQQRAKAIAMKFPQYRSYISYNAPSWRLRIGDFKTQEEAQKALQKVRAAFPAYGREMIVVRDRVNLWGN